MNVLRHAARSLRREFLAGDLMTVFAALALGAQGAGSADHHAPRFNPDPTVFWRGVHYWLTLATATVDTTRA